IDYGELRLAYGEHIVTSQLARRRERAPIQLDGCGLRHHDPKDVAPLDRQRRIIDARHDDVRARTPHGEPLAETAPPRRLAKADLRVAPRPGGSGLVRLGRHS